MIFSWLFKKKEPKTYDVGKLYIAIAYIEDAQGAVGHSAVEVFGRVFDPEDRFGEIEYSTERATAKIKQWFKQGFVVLPHTGTTEIVPIAKIVSMTINEPASYIVDESNREVTGG